MYHVLWKDQGTDEWFSEGPFRTESDCRDWAEAEKLDAEASEILFIERHMDDTISILTGEPEDIKESGGGEG